MRNNYLGKSARYYTEFPCASFGCNRILGLFAEAAENAAKKLFFAFLAVFSCFFAPNFGMLFICGGRLNRVRSIVYEVGRLNQAHFRVLVRGPLIKRFLGQVARPGSFLSYCGGGHLALVPTRLLVTVLGRWSRCLLCRTCF